ncbi:cytochrome c oxidase subunit 5B, mitochondrial-like isoform X2 [Euwallacea similis]|uniref:cytochrome c oxidase subunit 5B, mitochondrial-like isoform X2 n=1 Tax=Euwallacea similis TaxID=1736056 RepID=UPI00344EB700
MASFCRIVATAAKKNVWSPAVRCASSSVKVTFGDPLEHATGLEKREMLAKVAGNSNPFDAKVFKKGPGTRAQPTEIPSAYSARIVGCTCDEEATSISFMWLHMGEPKRCECGHWYKLVHKAPV